MIPQDDDDVRLARALKRLTGRPWLVRWCRSACEPGELGAPADVTVKAPRSRRVLRDFRLVLSDEDAAALRAVVRQLPSFLVTRLDAAQLVLREADEVADRLEAAMAALKRSA